MRSGFGCATRSISTQCGADLLGVVHETMRPVHASVWLRKG